ncbi:DUF1232 domain-containing protein [Shewanella sp. YLB-09]|uniref:DUF1232 domain-containing protein n=1 Tax=Shewanella eurypsychrophilus TaxID=2593656 RepID=A0A550AH77_9GAMM|nr:MULTISPECIES: YkvA family protein [Shewanella]QFU24190.1 DUF1232 domain-containing protein [Shewanella sp. YLB-09]
MATSTSSSGYSEKRFWSKCKRCATKIGTESLEKVLYLYYALDSPQCSTKHKATIYGALAYVVSPIDAIPDLTPVLGYTDDLTVVAAALVAVATCIDKEVRGKAKSKVTEVFS